MCLWCINSLLLCPLDWVPKKNLEVIFVVLCQSIVKIYCCEALWGINLILKILKTLKGSVNWVKSKALELFTIPTLSVGRRNWESSRLYLCKLMQGCSCVASNIWKAEENYRNNLFLYFGSVFCKNSFHTIIWPKILILLDVFLFMQLVVAYWSFWSELVSPRIILPFKSPFSYKYLVEVP